MKRAYVMQTFGFSYRCRRLGLTPLAYLWQRNQAELLLEMINAGLEAVLIKVAGIGLTDRHLGKSLAQMQPTLQKLVWTTLNSIIMRPNSASHRIAYTVLTSAAKAGSMRPLHWIAPSSSRELYCKSPFPNRISSSPHYSVSELRQSLLFKMKAMLEWLHTCASSKLDLKPRSLRMAM